MAIIINKHGHRLESFRHIDTMEELNSIAGIGGGHAILFHKGQLILCYMGSVYWRTEHNGFLSRK